MPVPITYEVNQKPQPASGARVTTAVGGWDMSFMVWNGWQSFAEGKNKFTDKTTSQRRHEFVGADIRGQLGKFLLKGEWSLTSKSIVLDPFDYDQEHLPIERFGFGLEWSEDDITATIESFVQRWQPGKDIAPTSTMGFGQPRQLLSAYLEFQDLREDLDFRLYLQRGYPFEQSVSPQFFYTVDDNHSLRFGLVATEADEGTFLASMEKMDYGFVQYQLSY